MNIYDVPMQRSSMTCDVLCTHIYICQNYKKESHNNLWWYNPVSDANIRLAVRPPALCGLTFQAGQYVMRWRCYPLGSVSAAGRADQPDLLSSGAKAFQWMSPSGSNLITSPICEVSRSLKKLCILQANPEEQEASGFLVVFVVFFCFVFLWSAFLSICLLQCWSWWAQDS